MITNCPNCGAPIDLSRRSCEYCGTPYLKKTTILSEAFAQFGAVANDFGAKANPLHIEDLNTLYADGIPIVRCPIPNHRERFIYG